MTTITVVCAWCGETIGEKDGQGVEGESHGICNKCLDLHFPHHADRVRAILEIKKIEEIYIWR